jgi:formate dehydrogenase major subunit
MTNHWIDLRNADCVLVMGSNAAANHPISFKWVREAMDRGATLICVDPRFNRTASQADIYARLRSGTDVAFLGGMINHILTNRKYHEEYLLQYTNSSFLVGSGYGFRDGLFSGYDPEKRCYNRSNWALSRDENGLPVRDKTLQDPKCVFQLLQAHFSRYTPETVSAVTGTAPEDLLRVWEAFSATGARNKAGTILYGMGWTQHSVGVQNIRAMCIIQLLLGNLGRPGGGVNALRGESNVQGSTDHGLLFDNWPGYLNGPAASMQTLREYVEKDTPESKDPLSANWWRNKPKYVVSLLKALFGDAATPENDFGYGWMPKVDDGTSCSWLDLFEQMGQGKFTGFFAWGQNPAVSSAHAGKVRKAMAGLKWLVTVNLFDNETSSFWRGPGMDPKEIGTEVFLLPCAASMEKEGSVTNSGRWMQWRYKAAEPPGEAKSDGDILVELWRRIRALYEQGGSFPEPILHFRLDHVHAGRFDPRSMARLINGYFEKDAVIAGKTYRKGTLLPSFTLLQADGSTSSGNWLYCNSYTEEGNMSARRGKADPTGMGLFSEWAWSWPVNRRILYNRASVDLKGRPWSAEKEILRWTADERWAGDVPDGEGPPMSHQAQGRYPFIMKPDGVASLFGPGLADGPFPEHYEPFESPVEKNPFSSRVRNPVARLYGSDAEISAPGDPRFPLVATTHRVTEHWQTGVISRWLPWLLETQPELFVEMSQELAGQLGIKNGEECTVSSARGRVNAVALVTYRMRPMLIHGRTVHQVSLPWCYGWLHPRDRGDAANLLTAPVGDPNTRIPETKAFMVNISRRVAP